MTRLLGWLAVYALLAFCGCTKSTQVQTDATTSVAVNREKQKETAKTDTSHVEIDKNKTVGPIETKKTDIEEKLGWIPPPPTAPPGTPPRWGPTSRRVVKTETKKAPVTTGIKIGKDTGSTANTKTNESDKATGTEAAKTKTIKKTDIGLSLWTKVWIAISVAVFVLATAAAAYFKPSLLGLPARAIKWLIGKLSKNKQPAQEQKP